MSYVFVSLNHRLHFMKVLVPRGLEETVALPHTWCAQCRAGFWEAGWVSYLKQSVWAAGVHAEVGRPMGILLNLCGGTPHDTVSGSYGGEELCGYPGTDISWSGPAPVCGWMWKRVSHSLSGTCWAITSHAVWLTSCE